MKCLSNTMQEASAHMTSVLYLHLSWWICSPSLLCITFSHKA